MIIVGIDRSGCLWISRMRFKVSCLLLMGWAEVLKGEIELLPGLEADAVMYDYLTWKGYLEGAERDGRGDL